MIATFIVPGEPKGKQRPRFNSKTKKTYTPKETKDYECKIRNSYNMCCGEFFDGAVKANITCYYAIPKSFSKGKKEKAMHNKIFPLVKPDLDNVAKVILDSLNGIAYKDDSQVVELNIKKVYSENPLVKVELYQVEEC